MSHPELVYPASRYDGEPGLVNARFRPADREVIHLRMLGYEVTEIADRTGRSLRTIERVLQKARTRLTAELA